MRHVEPMPDNLAARYRAWRNEAFKQRHSGYADLARGQAPQVMIIACCDSRVLVSEMFRAEAGDYFVHRNIAALVPPSQSPEGWNGTLSTVEFAVSFLAVRHILVVGHTGCGGVQGAHDLCRGEAAPELSDPKSFVGRWLQALAPVYQATSGLPDRDSRLAAFERETVRFSLRNLEALAFVREAAEAGRLSLHGALWNIADQQLEAYEPDTDRFVPIAL